MRETIFLRVLDATDKATALQAALADQTTAGPRRFALDPARFADIPMSSFAYWVSDRVRALFTTLPPFASDGRTARVGLQTGDDFRFVRAAWEVPVRGRLDQWFAFAKGGAYSPYYADIHLVVQWANDGQLMRNANHPRTGRMAAVLRNTQFYFRPGLTWTDRTSRALSVRPLRADTVFSHKGSGGFIPDHPLGAMAAMNSSVFDLLLSLLVGAGAGAARSYTAGTLASVPLPLDLADLEPPAHRAWSLKRGLDTAEETSHAFWLPALLQTEDASLAAGLAGWAARGAAVAAELAQLQATIDERCLQLYGLAAEDLASSGAELSADGPAEADEEDEVDETVGTIDAQAQVAELLSWQLGVVFGRFDLRLATGARTAPPEPEPFDPLPAEAPGLLPGGVVPADYPLAGAGAAVLVEDQGHPADLVARVEQVARVLWPETFDALQTEAAAILGVDTLRAWFANARSGFWAGHLRRYSRSSRTAPIYWMLSLPSQRYSVWLYYHRLTPDTLYAVLNDYVKPKLRREERRLVDLRQEGEPTPSRTQLKAREDQERLVDELRAFQDEVARVAPLWRPDLNDGVIINHAPLWRLVPHHKEWRKKLMECWAKLVAGEYDWAHLALHLWPERVIPKCATDRSLALAHGLDEVFWTANADGGASPRAVDPAQIEALIAERSSPAVKAALQSLLEAR